jgi:hypothetical protein
VQLYRYFVSQSSEFCLHNPLCCFSTSVYCCCLFRYRLSPETFGYTLILLPQNFSKRVPLFRVCVCVCVCVCVQNLQRLNVKMLSVLKEWTWIGDLDVILKTWRWKVTVPLCLSAKFTEAEHFSAVFVTSVWRSLYVGTSSWDTSTDRNAVLEEQCSTMGICILSSTRVYPKLSGLIR